MKLKIINEYTYDEFTSAISDFIKDKRVIDIKFTADSVLIALIMYEEPTQLKQKSFGNLASDEDINNFTEKHNVVRIERFQNEDTDVNTIITYREEKQ